MNTLEISATVIGTAPPGRDVLTQQSNNLQFVVTDAPYKPIPTKAVAMTKNFKRRNAGRIGEKIWVQMVLYIPPNTMMPVNVSGEGQVNDGRAVITVHDVRIEKVGANIGCFKNGSLLDKNFYRTPDVKTRQINGVYVDMGIIQNLGKIA